MNKPAHFGSRLPMFFQVFAQDPIDWIIILPCLALGLAGLKLLAMNEFWNQQTYGNAARVPVGAIIRKEGGVRYRPIDSLAWRDVSEQGSAVSVGDTVFTGNKGVAIIKLSRSGTSANILPNSLVTIKDAEAPPDSSQERWFSGLVKTVAKPKPPTQSIELKKGRIQVQIQAESPSIQVRANSETYRLESLSKQSTVELALDDSATSPGTIPAEADLTPNTHALRIVTDAGSEVKVTSAQTKQESTIVLSSNNTAILNKDAEPVIQEASLVANSPSDGTRLFVESATHANVAFRWKHAGTIQEAEELSLVVAGTAEKSIPVEHHAGEKQVELSPGRYRWRLRLVRQDKEVVTTPWTGLEIFEIKIPNPSAPASGTTITSSDGMAEITLAWTNGVPDSRTEIELHDGSGSRILTSELTSLAFELPLGKYTWQVRVVLSDGRASAWSNPFHFIIEEPQPPQPAEPVQEEVQPTVPPDVVSPPIEPPRPPEKIATKPARVSTQLKSTEDLRRLPVELSWTPPASGRTRKYGITIYRGDKLIIEQMVKEPRFSFFVGSLREPYSYEVVAIQESGEKIVSDRTQVAITVEAPIPRKPKQNAIVGNRVLLTWVKTALTEIYELQIASDRDFQSLVSESSLSNNFHVFEGVQAGKFYWRVRSKIRNLSSAWSETRAFHVNAPAVNAKP